MSRRHILNPLLSLYGFVLSGSTGDYGHCKATSCNADREDFLSGWAMMNLDFAGEGILVFISQGAPHKAHKVLVDLIAGGQVSMLAAGGVLSRFLI